MEQAVRPLGEQDAYTWVALAGPAELAVRRRSLEVAACLVAAWQGWALIAHLVVDPEFRGHGLGRWLLCRGLAALARSGRQGVMLMVTGGNRSAERLYTSLGFRRVGGDIVQAVLKR